MFVFAFILGWTATEWHILDIDQTIRFVVRVKQHQIKTLLKITNWWLNVLAFDWSSKCMCLDLYFLGVKQLARQQSRRSREWTEETVTFKASFRSSVPCPDKAHEVSIQQWYDTLNSWTRDYTLSIKSFRDSARIYVSFTLLSGKNSSGSK